MFASLFPSARTKDDGTNSTPANTTHDSFAQTWDATTQWKTSGRRNHQPRSRRNSPNPHLITSDLIGSTQPVSTSGRRVYLDKPLPPLPTEVFEMGLISTSKSPQDTSDAPNPVNTELSKEESPSNSSTKKDSSSRSRISSDSSIKGGAKRKSIFGIRHKKMKMQYPPVKLPMVDKGTQTTPAIEIPPQMPAKTDSSNPSPHSGYTYAIPSDTFFGSTRGLPTYNGGLKTPLWSPRSLLVGTGPSDYFGFPTEDSQRTTKGVPRSDANLFKNPSKRQTQQDVPITQHSSNTDTSMDSLGTYESRYSPRDGILQDAQSRPARKHSLLSSAGLSDPLVHQKHSPQPGTTTAENPGEDSLTSFKSIPESGSAKRPSLTRPLLHSIQKISHFNSRSFSRSHSSTRSESTGKGSPSLLRQELSYSDDDADVKFQNEPPSSQFFRMPIFGSASLTSGPTPPSSDADADVPEHFAGSPLCPMHPKHKSHGLGTCPYHGRRKSAADSVTGDGEYGNKERRESEEVLLLQERGEEDNFWTNVSRETRKRSTGLEGFKLAAVAHQEGSVMCPANARYGGPGKGVCVFHGRRRLGKLDSDESVPRLRM